MSEVIVQPGQTLRDICLQVYGRIDKLFQMAADNGFDTITPNLVPGHALNYNTELITDNTVVKYFAKNKITCASETDFEISDESFDETFDETFN